MMYKNDFVAVIKANGKILREDKDTVYVPFGAEYSIYMKNLRARDAVVRISIDGEDVLDGNEIIVRANSTLELERYLKDLNKGNRFKFIQKTSKIQEHRGDKIDDGIVRIEFQYEKEREVQHNYLRSSGVSKSISFDSFTTPTTSTAYYSSGDSTNITPTSFTVSSSSTVSNLNCDMLDGYHASDFVSMQALNSLPKAEEGITVKGSESTQKFSHGYIGPLEDIKHVVTLQLKGFTESGVVVKKPVDVKTKKECPTCGTTNKSINKYCRECGTFLE